VCDCSGSSGQLSPASTVSGPTRPSPIPFDDVDVPDLSLDLTAAIQSTYGRHLTASRRDPGDPGHPKVTPVERGQGQGQGRSVLEELSDRLQQGRRSRDALTSQKSDVMTPRAGLHDNGVRSAGSSYPLLVGYR